MVASFPLFTFTNLLQEVRKKLIDSFVYPCLLSQLFYGTIKMIFIEMKVYFLHVIDIPFDSEKKKASALDRGFFRFLLTSLYVSATEE